MQTIRASVAALTAFIANKPPNRPIDLRVVVSSPVAGGQIVGSFSEPNGPQPVINTGAQTVSMAFSGFSLPAAGLLVLLGLPNGKTIITNSDCVMSATDEIAAELLAAGWAPFTVPANYPLPIPVN